MSRRAIPLILCGATETIGRGVIDGLRPQYETIRFIMTPQAAAQEIPLLLTGRYHLLPPPTTELGTQNFSSRPKAVVFGAAFTDEAVGLVEKAMSEAGIMTDFSHSPAPSKRDVFKTSVPLLRADLKRATKPFGPEYAKEINERLKRCLSELNLDNTVGHSKSGVVWF